MAVREYVHAGHEVWVQRRGAGIGRTTRPTQAGGVVAGAAEVFAGADMIVGGRNRRPPSGRCCAGQIPLHLPAPRAGPRSSGARGLLDSGCIGVAYETVVTDERGGPAARADERGRRTPGDRGGGVRATQARRRQGLLMGGVPGVRRRAWQSSAAASSARTRAHGGRARRRGDDPRAVPHAPAPARRTVQGRVRTRFPASRRSRRR